MLSFAEENAPRIKYHGGKGKNQGTELQKRPWLLNINLVIAPGIAGIFLICGSGLVGYSKSQKGV